MLHVMEVLLDPLLNRGVASAKAVDLSQAGDSTLHVVPGHIRWNLPAEFLNKKNELGARSDDAHVAFQHVQELWEFVQAGPPQKTTNRGDSLIVSRSMLFVTATGLCHVHRPELEHFEMGSVQTDSFPARKGRGQVKST